MPVFDYKCKKCGYTTQDVLVDNPDKKVICKKCGHTMQLRMPAPNLKFRGPGFYETEYKDKS